MQSPQKCQFNGRSATQNAKRGTKNNVCPIYPSKSGTLVVTYIHPGGYEFPSDVPPLVVKFFHEQRKKYRCRPRRRFRCIIGQLVQR